MSHTPAAPARARDDPGMQDRELYRRILGIEAPIQLRLRTAGVEILDAAVFVDPKDWRLEQLVPLPCPEI